MLSTDSARRINCGATGPAGPDNIRRLVAEPTNTEHRGQNTQALHSTPLPYRLRLLRRPPTIRRQQVDYIEMAIDIAARTESFPEGAVEALQRASRGPLEWRSVDLSGRWPVLKLSTFLPP